MLFWKEYSIKFNYSSTKQINKEIEDSFESISSNINLQESAGTLSFHSVYNFLSVLDIEKKHADFLENPLKNVPRGILIEIQLKRFEIYWIFSSSHLIFAAVVCIFLFLLCELFRSHLRKATQSTESRLSFNPEEFASFFL